MFQCKCVLAAVAAVAGTLSQSQTASADGVMILGRTDVWAMAINASGDQNGNWTGQGVLADHSGGGRDVYLLDIQSGGEFDGIVVLGATASYLGSDLVVSVIVFADPATGEWEIWFPWLWVSGYEPVGIGDVRFLP